MGPHHSSSSSGTPYQLVLTILLLVSGNLSLHVSASSRGHRKLRSPVSRIPAIFAFGDANMDTGNNDLLNNTILHNNFPPLGRSFFGHPAGRPTDGRLVVDFLAQFLGLPLAPPSLNASADFRRGASFGSGGATAAPSWGLPGQNIPFRDQVSNFLDFRKLAGTSPRYPSVPTIKQALFLIQIGEVDFITAFLTGATVPFQGQAAVQSLVPGVQEGVLNATRDAIRVLYNSGARRFAVLAPYPLGCLPIMRNFYSSSNSTCVEYMNDIMSAFSENLGLLMGTLRSGLPGSTIIYIRSDKVLNLAIQNPAAAGFANTLDACCGTGTYGGAGPCGMGQYSVCPMGQRWIYWDWLHNSEALFQMVAWAAWRGSKAYVSPLNVEDLAGL